MATASGALATTSAATPETTDPKPARPGASPLDGLLLLRDQVRGTFAFNRTTLAGHLVGALAIELIFVGAAPLSLRIGWGVLFALVWLVRVALALRFVRNEPTDIAGLLRRLRTWQAGALASAALWGVGAWLFYGWGSVVSQIALVLVVFTFCVGSVPIMAPQFGVFSAFVLLAFVPTIAAVVAQHAALGWGLAVVMAAAMGMIMLLGRNYRQAFDANVALKLRTEALADALGACATCWGSDPRCPTCRGRGAPGGRVPVEGAFARYVTPAVERRRARRMGAVPAPGLTTSSNGLPARESVSVT